MAVVTARECAFVDRECVSSGSGESEREEEEGLLRGWEVKGEEVASGGRNGREGDDKEE